MKPAPDLSPFNGTVTRLKESPLLSAELFPPESIPGLPADALANINGPSVLRMPDWAPGKQAALHLYFGHHKGDSIRLAFADRLEGPWKMWTDPILPLAESLFLPVDPSPDPSMPEPDWVDALDGDYLYAHVASPDVHIDEANQRLVMYYHGLLPGGDQQTRLATSTDGINFKPREPLLGPPYFRATKLNGMIYLSMWEGRLGRTRSWEGPIDLAPKGILPDDITGAPDRQIRHGHVFAHQGRLHLTFSRIGDAPERLLHCELNPAEAGSDWSFGPVSEMLRPAAGWEGGNLPVAASVMGTVMERVNELRDPALFLDQGQVWIAYCGGGESGIGIARVEGL